MVPEGLGNSQNYMCLTPDDERQGRNDWPIRPYSSSVIVTGFLPPTTQR